MKNESIGRYFVLNGELHLTENNDIFREINGPSIYEVIRIINGVPLFLEEHIDRMRGSSSLVNYNINKANGEIREDIKILIGANNVENMNIKLLCTDVEGCGQVFLAYFIESHYPDECTYKKGINTILYHSERENPNAKILNTTFKENVNKLISEKNAYEAILVNDDGYITEGSRSNMFFIWNLKVYTASSKEVLLGVTRKHIMKVCDELKLDVVEENIHTDDLGKIDGAFMSGTSVNVLPISTIDDFSYDSVNNHIIMKIANGYLREIEEYIKENKGIWGRS